MLYLILNNLRQIKRFKIQFIISTIIYGIGIGILIGFISFGKNSIKSVNLYAQKDRITQFGYFFNSSTFFKTANGAKNRHTGQILTEIQSNVTKYNKKYKTHYSLLGNSNNSNNSNVHFDKDNWHGNNSVTGEKVAPSDFNFYLNEYNPSKRASSHCYASSINSPLSIQLISHVSCFYLTTINQFTKSGFNFSNFTPAISLANSEDGKEQNNWNQIFNNKNKDFIGKIEYHKKDRKPTPHYWFDFTKCTTPDGLNIPCRVSHVWAKHHHLIANKQNYMMANTNGGTSNSVFSPFSSFQNQAKKIRFYIIGYTDSPTNLFVSSIGPNRNATLDVSTPVIIPTVALLYINEQYLQKKISNFQTITRYSSVLFNLFASNNGTPSHISETELRRWELFLYENNYEEKKTIGMSPISSSQWFVDYFDKSNKVASLTGIIFNYYWFRKYFYYVGIFIYMFAIILIICGALLLIIMFKRQIDFLRKIFGVLKASGFSTTKLMLSWIGYAFLTTFFGFGLGLLTAICFQFTSEQFTHNSWLITSSSANLAWLWCGGIAVVSFLAIYLMNILVSWFVLRENSLALLTQTEKISLGSVGRRAISFFWWAPLSIRFGISIMITAKMRTIFLLAFIFLASVLIVIAIFSQSMISNIFKVYKQNSNFNIVYRMTPPIHLYENVTPINTSFKNIFSDSNDFYDNDRNFKLDNKSNSFSENGATLSQMGINKWSKTKFIPIGANNPSPTIIPIPALRLQFNINNNSDKPNDTISNKTYHYKSPFLQNLTNKRFFLSKDSFTEVQKGTTYKSSVFDLYSTQKQVIPAINKILHKTLPYGEQKNLAINTIIDFFKKNYESINLHNKYLIIENDFFLYQNIDSPVSDVDGGSIPPPFKTNLSSKLTTKPIKIRFFNPTDYIEHKINRSLGNLPDDITKKSNLNKLFSKHLIPIITPVNFMKQNDMRVGDTIPIQYSVKKTDNVPQHWEQESGEKKWSFKIVKATNDIVNNFLYINNFVIDQVTQQIKDNKEVNYRWPLWFYEIAPVLYHTKKLFLKDHFSNKYPPAWNLGVTKAILSQANINYVNSREISQIPLLLNSTTNSTPQSLIVSVYDWQFYLSVMSSKERLLSSMLIIIGVVFVFISLISIISLNSNMINQNRQSLTVLKMLGFSATRLNILYSLIYVPIIVIVMGVATFVSIEILNWLAIYFQQKTNIVVSYNYSAQYFVLAFALIIGTYFLSVVTLNWLLQRVHK